MQDWRERLEKIVATMREVSAQTDPQEMVRAYGRHMAELLPSGSFLSISRRDTEPPWYRIARASKWSEQPNPWRERDKLPVLKGGLLSELIYSNEAHVIDDLEFSPDDPAAEYLEGHRSLLAIPVFDEGIAKNMVIRLRPQRAGFDREAIPNTVWFTNLLGRATHNLVLSQDLRETQRQLDRELDVVAAMQKSLLPPRLPDVPRLDLAVHYAPSRHAGGDYYDVFPLPDGRWGFLVADVSGHGVPAAVLMAITHAIAHLHPGPPTDPAAMLEYLSARLHARYTKLSGTFVTAFYGVFDPDSMNLTYALAGHPPPRLQNCVDGALTVLSGEPGPPLGILPEQQFTNSVAPLRPHDQMVLYTDGVVEARNPEGRLFGTERLDEVLHICGLRADFLIAEVMGAVERFTEGRPLEDDTTLLVALVS